MTARRRKQSIDMLRIVAAFGIVWAHMQAPGMLMGYLALALFTILVAFLSVRSLRRGGQARFWLGRAGRFLLPWLVWSLAYRAVMVLRSDGTLSFFEVNEPLWLLIGPEIHLWFLPFVIISSPLVLLSVWLLTTPWRVAVGAVVCVPIAIGAIWMHDNLALAHPFGQWAFALPPLLYGMLSAQSARHGWFDGWPVAPMLYIAVAGGAAMFVWGSVIAPFLVSATLMFEALWRIDWEGSFWTGAGSLAFGIYLIHPAVMLFWYKFAVGLPTALGAVVVFAVSALIIWLVRLTPPGKLLA